MGLLQDIRAGAVDSQTDITTVLRQCMVLAFNLDHEPFRQWVSYELNGYPHEVPLPDYRQYVGQPRGSARNMAWQMTNAQIPLSAIPEEFREMATHIYFREGIGYFTKVSPTQELGFFWQPELVQFVSSRLNGNLDLTEVKVIAPINFVDGMVDRVRNSILDFVLRIEKENPEAGDVPSGTQPIPLDRVNNIFLTAVHGGNALLGNAGETNVSDYHIHDSSLGILNPGTISDVGAMSANRTDRSSE